MDLERTITFALPNQVESAQIRSILETKEAKVWVVDRYDFAENNQPFRSITYRLAFPNKDGSRSAESVNHILQECIENVLDTFGDQGVFIAKTMIHFRAQRYLSLHTSQNPNQKLQSKNPYEWRENQFHLFFGVK